MEEILRTASGLLLGLVSAVMTGSFSLPMKKTTRWSWEATWLVWSVCALCIIPLAIAVMTVPDMLSGFSKAATTDIILVFAFGLCWELGAVIIVSNTWSFIPGEWHGFRGLRLN